MGDCIVGCQDGTFIDVRFRDWSKSFTLRNYSRLQSRGRNHNKSNNLGKTPQTPDTKVKLGLILNPEHWSRTSRMHSISNKRFQNMSLYWCLNAFPEYYFELNRSRISAAKLLWTTVLKLVLLFEYRRIFSPKKFNQAHGTSTHSIAP